MPQKKGKNKVSKHDNSQQKLSGSSVKSSNVEPSVLGVNNLTHLEISQLSFNIQDEGPSTFYLYGDKLDNLVIERD